MTRSPARKWLWFLLSFLGAALALVFLMVLLEPVDEADAAAPQFVEQRVKAEAGDAVARFKMAGFYARGEGVAQDLVEAARWLKLAAEQGYAPAQNNLAVCYSTGAGVPKDQGGKVYGDIFLQAEKEFSTFNFERASTDILFRHFQEAEAECQMLLDGSAPLALPAYDQCMKASHVFNLLDARGVISVAERQRYIGRVRSLAVGCCEAWVNFGVNSGVNSGMSADKDGSDG